MANSLYTIGYEGRTLDNLVGVLKGEGVDCLIDVREIPLSRKRGFSKSALAGRLAQEDIHYVHFRELGSPKPLRDEVKATGDYAAFFTEMDKHLSAQTEAIETVYEQLVDRTCCLMCFERLASQCHRKVVARKLIEHSANALEVTHL